jgi:hypothetical protein
MNFVIVSNKTVVNHFPGGPFSTPVRPTTMTPRSGSLETLWQVAASVFSLLNDFRISEGKPPLGFLNPWIYSCGSTGFNDITSNSNQSCGTRLFPALTGWDAVSTARFDVPWPCGSAHKSRSQITGLGTPDFLKLKWILDPDSD